MVFVWGWRPMGWRWIAMRQQNIPKYITGLVCASLLAKFSMYTSSELLESEGFNDSFETKTIAYGNQILDERKMVILASRRWNMLKDRAEAQEYFASKGYKPRPSNQYMILSDSLGH